MNKELGLTWRQRAPYLLEVQQVVAGLSRRLRELERASDSWAKNDDSLDLQLEDESSVDADSFADTLQGLVDDQTVFFDALEGFLAAWARLSLLLFPDAGKDPTSEFRAQRGEALRRALGVKGDSVLADRDLRNAWMHFDERLDRAIVDRTFGNRHAFVRSVKAADYSGKSVILMEIDTLVVHFIARNGETRVVDLKELWAALEGLHDAARKAIKAG